MFDSARRTSIFLLECLLLASDRISIGVFASQRSPSHLQSDAIDDDYKDLAQAIWGASERFNTMPRIFRTMKHEAVIVHDLRRRNDIERIERWG